MALAQQRALQWQRLNRVDQLDEKHPDRWIPNRAFWDTLPRIYLTRRALQELDRRNHQQDLNPQTDTETAPPPQLARPRPIGLLRCVGDENTNPDLRRFARHGGPDLTDILTFLPFTMSQFTMTPETANSKRKPLTKPSGPYDANYELKLAQAGVFLPGGLTAVDEMDETGDDNAMVMPANYDAIQRRLNERRPSLSPSNFTEEEFRRFKRQAIQARAEVQHEMTVIQGHRGQYHSDDKRPFNNSESFDHTIAMAVPDSYDGAQPLTIDPRVYSDLNKHIMPTTDGARPAAPNFFLEIKGPMGRADVATRQAGHVGAIGTRAMMSLQSYPNKTPQYDGNAYSFTCTYSHNQLVLYAAYATAPKAPGDPPQYHMAHLDAFAMAGNSDTFRKGATYYRNARALAKEMRDSFIQQANQTARQMPPGKRNIRNRTTTKKASGKPLDGQVRERTPSPDMDTDADTIELAHEGPSKRPRIDSSVPSGDTAPTRHPTTTTGRERQRSEAEIKKKQSKKTFRPMAQAPQSHGHSAVSSSRPTAGSNARQTQTQSRNESTKVHQRE